MNEPPTVNIVTLSGTIGVGKSCMIIRHFTNNICHDYDPTIEDNYRQQLYVDDEQYIIDVWDTVGEELLEIMLLNWDAASRTKSNQSPRSGNMLMWVFSLTSMASFIQMIALHDRFASRIAYLPCIVVGTKCDVMRDGDDIRLQLADKYPQWSSLEQYYSHCYATCNNNGEDGILLPPLYAIINEYVVAPLSLPRRDGSGREVFGEGKVLAQSWHAPYVECSTYTRVGMDDVFITAVRHTVRSTPALIAKPPPSSGRRCMIQ